MIIVKVIKTMLLLMEITIINIKGIKITKNDFLNKNVKKSFINKNLNKNFKKFQTLIIIKIYLN